MSAVNINPIRTDAEYRAALIRVREMFHAPDDSPEADELEVLTILVHECERLTESLGAFPGATDSIDRNTVR